MKTLKSIQRLFLEILILFLFCSYSLMAQNKGSIELTPAMVHSERPKIITEVLGLTEQENLDFKPLYQAYQDEIAKLNNPSTQTSPDSISNVTDDEAWLLLDEYLKFQKDKINVQRKYANKFRTILPPKKAALFFHLENKLDAIVSYHLAGNAPLAY